MVSPASARDPTNGQEHYIAYVNLLPTEDAIVQLNGMKLVPGMPAEVFVSTQERTVASYLIETLHRSDESRLPRALRALTSSSERGSAMPSLNGETPSAFIVDPLSSS